MESRNRQTDIENLIATYFTQGLGAEQLLELQNWIKATPENRKQFLQMREVWFSSIGADEADRYDKDKAFDRFLVRTEKVQERKTVAKKRYLHTLLYSAAAIALLFIISYASYWSGREQVKKQFADMVVEAPLGSKTKLYLPDGTLVWLNAGSRISYSQGFGVVERKLNLIGEGYFEVTKNEELPFEVQTKELQVNVVGTKFNIRNYPEDEYVRVSLLEGKVYLQNSLKNNDSCYLQPNQKAILNKKSRELQVSAVKAQYDSEWTNGYLFFDEELLPDIIKILERSYNVNIHLADESLNTFRFYGNFERREQTIEEILDMLGSTNRLKYKIKGKEVVLTSR